jgi:Tir chaperone protein (CesT).
MEQRSIKEIMADFGQAIGYPELALDEDGSCLLAAGEQALFLSCPEGAVSLLVYAPVGEPPEGPHRAELAEELLAANAYNEGTRGLTLGLSSERDLIMLSGTLPVSLLDAASLQSFLQFFMEQAVSWEQYIDDFPRSKQRDEQDDNDVPGGIRV